MIPLMRNAKKLSFGEGALRMGMLLLFWARHGSSYRYSLVGHVDRRKMP